MNAENTTADDSSDSQKLLLSVIIYNYEGGAFESLLAGIFQQRHIMSFEVILCDDATSPEVWEIGNHYVQKYPDRITLVRNQVTMEGQDKIAVRMLSMINGQYYVELSLDRKFNPEYVAKTIAQLESDPLLIHSYVGRVSNIGYGKPSPEANRSDGPLVSICIYNYNYGRFLSQCLESVAAQTYENIEICFSDNASTDDSWQIALDFSNRYAGKMSLVRNRRNFGPAVNLANTRRNARGKYLLYLCSDDAIKPDFVERCVTLLEKYPQAIFAMVHRDILDDIGNVTTELPFYDQTCLIPGEEQAAVYMMAAVNPSISQILYRREKMKAKLDLEINSRWLGQRLLDFMMCLEYPILYIKEPLLLNRVHGSSDGSAIDTSLIQGFAQYLLAHQFSDIAAGRGVKKPGARLHDAIEKVGRLCLRYCVQFLSRGDEVTALRYLHLAQAIFPDILKEEAFTKLQGYWQVGNSDATVRKRLLESLSVQANVAVRKVSYAPPQGSIPC